MPNVVVVGTGGTIASGRAVAGGPAVAAVDSADLVAGLAARGLPLPDGARVRTEQFCLVGSFLFDLDLAFRIAKRVDQILAEPEVDGVVVTQGTDTMEESAFMADIVVTSNKPVVYTGAQFTADDPDPDGPRNLRDAIRLASTPRARGLGTLIAFDSEAHAARDVSKRHTSRVGTFQSAEHGKVADIDGDDVVIHRRPALRQTIRTEAIESRVDLIKLAMGADARFIRCALATGARGIVIEAFGRGNANPDVNAGIRDAVKAGVPVMITTRCPEGRVKPVYGNGGGRDVEAAGAMFAGDLQGVKARVLLSVLLGARPPLDVASTFRAFAG